MHRCRHITFTIFYKKPINFRFFIAKFYSCKELSKVNLNDVDRAEMNYDKTLLKLKLRNLSLVGL